MGRLEIWYAVFPIDTYATYYKSSLTVWTVRILYYLFNVFQSRFCTARMTKAEEISEVTT